MDALSVVFPRLHPEGLRFIIGFGIATLLLFLLWEPAGWLGLLATVWCYYFFRDPDRHTPLGPGLVIAPADGVVCAVDQAAPPSGIDLPEAPVLRVGIFMNVFNCHVNRMPVDGKVTRSVYHEGKFLNASLDKASDENERQILAIDADSGEKLAVVQIAGLIARRIVCHVQEGDDVLAGERFGIIRFGSRVDVYMPASASLLVAKGQKIVAGETVLADLTGTSPQRQVVIRCTALPKVRSVPRRAAPCRSSSRCRCAVWLRTF